MKDLLLILILCICLNMINCFDEILFISIYSIKSGNSHINFQIYNESHNIRPITDFIYTGSFENIEKIISNYRNNTNKIKSKKYPWVYIPNTCSFNDVKFFSNETIFIVDTSCTNNKSKFLNYSDYTFTYFSYFDYYLNKEDKSNFYYAKIGVNIDLKILIILGSIFVVTLITGIICYIITRKKFKKIFILFILPVYLNNLSLYFILYGANMANLFLILLTNEKLDLLVEYLLLIVQSLYKAYFYASAILILQGWDIIRFDLRKKFKKYFLYFLSYNIGFCGILNLSLYFIHITSKLNLYYFKSDLEQIVFMTFLIYSIYKTLIPLYKQKIYEERLRSNLVDCLTFKYKKLFKVFIFFSICSVLTFIFPFIEHAVLNVYLYDFHFHYTFNIIYELISCAGLNFIFLSINLPFHYYENIIFNYREISTFIADIIENEDKNRFNISKLNSANLKDAKKNDSPILFINPFTSNKNSLLYNQIHLGFITNNK